MNKPKFDLYLVLECSIDGRPAAGVLTEITKRLGGLSGRIGFELRDKRADVKTLYETALALREVADASGCAFLVNDRIDVALAAGADGVHLGGGSIRADDARRLIGPEKLIGVSTHGVEEARRAGALGADFITLSPLYFTPSKAKYGEPIGLEPLKSLVASGYPLPIYGLGGVDASNTSEVVSLGASGVAMIRGVLASPDPAAAAGEILEAVDEGIRRRPGAAR